MSIKVLFPHLPSFRDFYETALGLFQRPVPCKSVAWQQENHEFWLKR